MQLALGAVSWVVDNVAGQLGVIVEHVHRHEQLLDGHSAEQRDTIEDRLARVVNVQAIQAEVGGPRGFRPPPAGVRR